MRQDLRHALRLALRQPGFTAVVSLTLALGIGANTALFSVLQGVLLSPLPYPDPDQIVLIWEHQTTYGWTHNGFPAAPVREYRERNQTFQAMGAFVHVSSTLTGEGDPERLSAQVVTHEVLEILGARPAVGRLLVPGDELPGRAPVVVLGHGFWQRRFGGDPEVVGRQITLDGEPVTVVGVLSEGFRPVQGNPDLWAPLALSGEAWADWRNHFLFAVGRLREGVGLDQGTADLLVLARQLQEANPRDYAGALVTVESLREATVGAVTVPLWMMMAAAGLVLLIACANVANLYLSRGLAREREFALRTTLGAGRRRLLHLLTTESLVLILPGGFLGVGLALAGLRVLLALEPGRLPRVEEIGLNGWVLLFSAGITLCSSALFGVVPAFRAARNNLAGSLKEAGSRSTQSSGPRRLKSGLAVVQMTLAILLLAGAGLLTRSFIRLQGVDPGFRVENILQARLSLAGGQYREREQIVAFLDRLQERLTGDPSVSGMAAVSSPPVSMTPQVWLHIEGREPEGDQPPVVSRVFATAGYFDLLGLTVLEGRLFDEGDRLDQPRVAVLTRSAAERHWPGESPVGKVIRIGTKESSPMMVIGVVSDLRQYGIRHRPYPTAFIPFSQAAPSEFTVMIQAPRGPAEALESLKIAVGELDSALPLYQIRTLDEVMGADVAEPRFAMFLAGVFGVAAMILAAVGIYGVLAYTVSQRTHELGIRLALGAGRQGVLQLVLRQGLGLAGMSLALGLPGAFAFARLMDSFLFEVGPADPLTFALLALSVLTVALVACVVPAVRAAWLDPVGAMRRE